MSAPSDTKWTSFFRLEPKYKDKNTLGQTIAKGLYRIMIRYGFEDKEKEIMLNFLEWVIHQAKYYKSGIIEKMAETEAKVVNQMQFDLLRGIANCLVDPHYCAHTSTAAGDNAEEWVWVFENVEKAVKDGTIDGKEGNESRKPVPGQAS